jgi:hypothetical protein
MPEQSRRVYATYTVRFSKTVRAPVRYAYDWCTDFRNDDGKFSRSKPRFRVLRVGPDRVVRIRTPRVRARTPAIALELIRLNPPDAWHVDQIDEADLETTDYKVSRITPKQTRVTLVITERWMVPRHPARSEYRRAVTRYWDGLVAALEKRYQSGLPARG